MIRTLLMATALVLLMAFEHPSRSLQQPEASQTAKIYYTPIFVQPPAGRPAATFEANAAKFGEPAVSEPDFTTLLRLLRSAKPGKFSDSWIAAKIVLPGAEVIYIDSDGGVKFTTKTAKVSRPTLDSVLFLLDMLTCAVKRK